MKTINHYLIFLFFGVIFLSLSGIASAKNYCLYLAVQYNSMHYKLDKQSCTHGSFTNSTPGFIMMRQGTGYGPDCTIKATSTQDPTKFVIFEAQQNYCFLEAGDIHVRQSSANPPSLRMQYSVTGGSYGSRAGKINFNGF